VCWGGCVLGCTPGRGGRRPGAGARGGRGRAQARRAHARRRRASAHPAAAAGAGAAGGGAAGDLWRGRSGRRARAGARAGEVSAPPAPQGWGAVRESGCCAGPRGSGAGGKFPGAAQGVPQGEGARERVQPRGGGPPSAAGRAGNGAAPSVGGRRAGGRAARRGAAGEGRPGWGPGPRRRGLQRGAARARLLPCRARRPRGRAARAARQGGWGKRAGERSLVHTTRSADGGWQRHHTHTRAGARPAGRAGRGAGRRRPSYVVSEHFGWGGGGG
jgi:hypothetical protein